MNIAYLQFNLIRKKSHLHAAVYSWNTMQPEPRLSSRLQREEKHRACSPGFPTMLFIYCVRFLFFILGCFFLFPFTGCVFAQHSPLTSQ